MKQQFINAYIKLERLADDVRLMNGVRSKERLDCTNAALNGYEGLKCFANMKGQMFFYRTETKDIVEANSKRRAEYALTNGKLNFSSVYIEDLEFPHYGYGYPNGKRLLSNGAPNPLYPFSNDGYLFIVNNDYTEIEVLIVKDGRYLITHYYQQMIDGLLDEEMNQLRQQATTFYPYSGL